MTKFLIMGIIALILLVSVGVVSAVTVPNFGFENSGPVPAGGYLTCPPGSLNDWSIGGSVDVVSSTYWQSHSGVQSVDLAGNGPGTISQTLNVGTNQICSISFWMAGNPDGGPAIKTLDVYFGSHAPVPFTFDTTGHSRPDNMGWTLKTASGLTASGLTSLQFADTGTGPWGPALDDISVDCVDQSVAAAIPEFPSMALPAALIVGILGAVLFIKSTKEN